MNDFLTILKHDLHKLEIKGALPHAKALEGGIMKKCDGIASWFSRNGGSIEFDRNEKLYIRDSYIIKIKKEVISSQIDKKRKEIFQIFEEIDPRELHYKILDSKLLNKFSEARQFPFSSYKYHLLLACSLYYNMKNGYEWEKLYLAETEKVEDQFQLIYKDKSREWALLPTGGMSRVSPQFNLTWLRRTEMSIGGEDRFLDGLLSQIGSWSTALSTIEDWMEER